MEAGPESGRGFSRIAVIYQGLREKRLASPGSAVSFLPRRSAI